MNNSEIISRLNCPFYEDEHILFLNTDCMKLMEILPDKYFHLAICDPPYNVGASDGMFGRSSKHNSYRPDLKHYQNYNQTPNQQYFTSLFNVSHNQIIWGMNYYPQYLQHNGAIVWEKKTVNPGILSDAEIAYCSVNKMVRVFKYNWFGFNKGNNKEAENKTNDKAIIHPNQKPIALYLWLLDKYAKSNQLIFDSHVGSASSLIACMQKSFKCIGTELDADYFHEAVKRIQLERAKLDNNFYIPDSENFLFKKE